MISTIGIHEVRGYARQFSSIGLKPELAEIFQTRGLLRLATRRASASPSSTRDADERQRILAGEEEAQAGEDVPLLPEGLQGRDRGRQRHRRASRSTPQKVRELERESPISMRHIIDLQSRPRRRSSPTPVDAGVGHHDYPIVISSMSFGSQSEPAFRAYAEAAKAINILCINGEGGEIRDMYGKYRKWRGQQVASGRFGVSAEMLNSSYLAEIKIGQGAKPGEGGHLPGQEGLREGRRGAQRVARAPT